MSYSKKLDELVRLGRAVVFDGLIVSVDGDSVDALKTAPQAAEEHVLLPRLPHIREVEAGWHPVVADCIANAVLEMSAEIDEAT